MGVASDMLRSWRAPRAVMRARLADGVREDRVLMILMLACFLIFIAQWPVLARESHLDPEIPLQVRIGGALFGWMFIAPLMLYGLSGLLWLGLRLGGVVLTGFAVRMALFWTLLAAAPLWLLHGLLRGAVGPGTLTTGLGFAVLAATVWLLVTLVREAALVSRAATP